MKLFKTLTCLLILSLSCASYTEAKGRSFGGGFRSQRMAPAPRAQAAPATQGTQTKSIFGSFGRAPAAPGAAPQNAQSLNMSKDLNTNVAQSNALKISDARTASGATTGAGAVGTAANNGANNSGWFRSGKPAAPAQQAGQPISAKPIIVQQRGGGFLNNAMWFMLGSSLARNHQPSANQNVQNENVGGQVADSQVTEPMVDMAPAVEEKESFFVRFLRLALWGAILFGLYKLVTNIMQTKKNSANKKPNYTFGN